MVRGLSEDYLLGLEWQQRYRIGTAWSRNGQQFINIEFVALSEVTQLHPIIKTQGSVRLIADSISIVECKLPANTVSRGAVEIDYKLHRDFIPLDVIHQLKKNPMTLQIPIMNTQLHDIIIPKDCVLGKIKESHDKSDTQAIFIPCRNYLRFWKI